MGEKEGDERRRGKATHDVIVYLFGIICTPPEILRSASQFGDNSSKLWPRTHLFSSPVQGLVTGLSLIGENLKDFDTAGSGRLLEGNRESHHTHTEDHRREIGVGASEATRQIAYRATAAGRRDKSESSDAEEHVGDRKRRVNRKTKAASEPSHRKATPIGRVLESATADSSPPINLQLLLHDQKTHPPTATKSNLHVHPLRSKKSPQFLTFAAAFAGYTQIYSTTTRRNAQWNPPFHPNTQTFHQTCITHQCFSSLRGPPRVAPNTRMRKSLPPPDGRGEGESRNQGSLDSTTAAHDELQGLVAQVHAFLKIEYDGHVLS
ncbi:hypothetical protein F5887DRAFT_1072821 [Amanita rubescens]|nr:hypothetical protein F5887DRAFT_1084637 [Amanita rubescens]KAF8347302.1 hypothetical protein F5887DRAFT_1072821 [Amanita rubescens]